MEVDGLDGGWFRWGMVSMGGGKRRRWRPLHDTGNSFFSADATIQIRDLNVDKFKFCIYFLTTTPSRRFRPTDSRAALV